MALFLHFSQLKSSRSIHQLSKFSHQHLNQAISSQLLHLNGEDWKANSRHHEHVNSMETMAYMALCAGMINISKQNCNAFTHNAQKLLHMYPHLNSARLMLKIALNIKEFANSYKKQHAKFFTVISQQDGDTNKWLNQFNYWNGFETQENYEINDLLSCLSHLRNNKSVPPTNLVECFENIKSVDDLLHIGSVCKNNGLIEAPLKCFQKAFDLSSNDGTKFLCCLRICHSALVGYRESKDESMKNVLEENVRRIVLLKPNSAYAILMQGLMYKAIKNLRKARTVLSRIVYGANETLDFTLELAVLRLKEVLVERNDSDDLQKLDNFITASGGGLVAS